jgi:hypothetical protein
MKTLPPVLTPPKKSKKRILGWTLRGVVVVAIIAVTTFLISVAIEQRQQAEANRLLEERQGKIKPFLDAARANRALIEVRMKADRPRRIATIAARTGLLPEYIEDHFGWFTGIDEPVVSFQSDRPMPKGQVSVGVLNLTKKLFEHFHELNSPESVVRVFDIMRPNPILETYEHMTTAQAVKESIRTTSTLGRATVDLNSPPRESKYDSHIDRTAYEDAAMIVVAIYDAPFGWLIEQELITAGDGKVDFAVAHVIEFLSGAVDRRIEFMIHDIESVQNLGASK